MYSTLYIWLCIRWGGWWPQWLQWSTAFDNIWKRSQQEEIASTHFLLNIVQIYRCVHQCKHWVPLPTTGTGHGRQRRGCAGQRPSVGSREMVRRGCECPQSSVSIIPASWSHSSSPSHKSPSVCLLQYYLTYTIHTCLHYRLTIKSQELYLYLPSSFCF